MIDEIDARSRSGVKALPLLAFLFVIGSASAQQPGPGSAPLPPERPGGSEPSSRLLLHKRSPNTVPVSMPPLPVTRPEPAGPPRSRIVAPLSPEPGSAAQVPLPEPRPEENGPFQPASLQPQTGRLLGSEEFGPKLPSTSAPRPAWAGTVPSAEDLQQACARILASGKISAARAPAVTGAEGCGIDAPLTLRAILLPNGHSVSVDPPAVLRCDLAEQLADWIRDDISPIPTGKGEITAVSDAAAYMCRGRNNAFGAQMSEHGHGDAIDVLAFRFAGGSFSLQQADSHPFWSAAKQPTCARFKTVLGPGSDGHHEDHLHIDLETRRNGSHYCHWDNP